MSASCVPMPGATRGTTRLPFEHMKHPGWPTLRKSDAINFTNASPVSLGTGTTLYRVYGGPAPLTGSYWSPGPPALGESEARWRGNTAVELSWNDATHVGKVTIEGSPVLAWEGGIAPQPAQDMQCQYLAGYLLPGGGQQYWVPLGDLPRATGIGPTPWSPTAHRCPPSSAAAGPLAGGAAHAAHSSQLARRAQLLREAVSANPGLSYVSALADRLERESMVFMLYLSEFDRPARVAQVGLAIRSHAALRRHIELDPEMAGFREVDGALEDLIASAVALAGDVS